MIEVLKNINLLFVEDDDILREQYGYTLRSFFSEVIEARNGIEALERFSNHTIHCIISDIVMPDMNGLELTREIRYIDQKIPIILLSSHPTQENLLAAVKLNLVDFLIKPASYTDIKTALSNCADKMIKDGLLNVSLSDNITYSSLNKSFLRHDVTYPLTKKESLLIELLIKYRGKIVTKERIEEIVYPHEEMSNPALKNLVLKLRKKLSENIIINISGHGFLLQ